MLRKVREVMVLFFVGITSAFLLSFVYQKTMPLISKHSEKKSQKLLSEIYPSESVTFKEIKADTLWKVLKEERCIGIIFRFSEKGYSSEIRPFVAVDSLGQVLRVKIPKEGLSETPGLGMKITEEGFQEQFGGLTQDEIWLKKDKEEGQIDAITSATISSRAATDAVRKGLIEFKKHIPEFSTKKFLENSLDSIKKHSESEFEEIKHNKLWESPNSYIYLSKTQDSSGTIHILVHLRGKIIKEVFIERKEKASQEEKISIREEIEKRIRNISIEDIDKVDVVTGTEKTFNKIKEAIKSGYKNLVKEEEE